MKIAELVSKGLSVEMHYDDKLGYSVISHRELSGSSTLFIPTREEADWEFLWYVGYPKWEAEAASCFQQAKERWMKAHPTIKSVGAKWIGP